MSDYVITTDSNSDVLPAFIKENSLTIIPQYYAFGDTVYGDQLNMEPHEFYETMRKGELPKSMANNPEVIREKMEPKSPKECVCDGLVYAVFCRGQAKETGKSKSDAVVGALEKQASDSGKGEER